MFRCTSMLASPVSPHFFCGWVHISVPSLVYTGLYYSKDQCDQSVILISWLLEVTSVTFIQPCSQPVLYSHLRLVERDKYILIYHWFYIRECEIINALASVWIYLSLEAMMDKYDWQWEETQNEIDPNSNLPKIE